MCGGGLTKYECIFAGIPVASFAQTPSQQADTDTLAKQGLISDLGPAYDSAHELPIDTFTSYFNDQPDYDYANDCSHSIVGSEDVKTALIPFFIQLIICLNL